MSRVSRFYLGIGVQEYTHFEHLAFAGRDCAQLSSIFARVGFATDILFNPNRATVQSNVRGVLKNCAPGDLMVIHFAGHGLVQGREQLLLLPDADLTATHFVEVYALGDLLKELRSVPGLNVVFLIDACRVPLQRSRGGGSLLGTRSPRSRDAGARKTAQGSTTNNITVVYACSDDARAPEVKSLKHGLFSKALFDLWSDVIDTGRPALMDHHFETELRSRMSELARKHILEADVFVQPMVERNSEALLLWPARSIAEPFTSMPPCAPLKVSPSASDALNYKTRKRGQAALYMTLTVFGAVFLTELYCADRDLSFVDRRQLFLVGGGLVIGFLPTLLLLRRTTSDGLMWRSILELPIVNAAWMALLHLVAHADGQDRFWNSVVFGGDRDVDALGLGVLVFLWTAMAFAANLILIRRSENVSRATREMSERVGETDERAQEPELREPKLPVEPPRKSTTEAENPFVWTVREE